MKQLFKFVMLLGVFACVTFSLKAQLPVPDYQPLAADQLDQLLGPIALYPDPLIALILPAATLPTEIVLADRYVNGGGDPNQIDRQSWDPSVQGMARYPALLKWMDDNLGWTTTLGQAFLNQQQDVMDSIQRLRTTAINFGNLQSTPQQQVINDGGYIEIVPTDPQLIYVPVYQPDQVYDENANGAPFITFGVGWPIGIWLDGDMDWANRHIVVWGRDHPRPANWWHETSRQRNDGHTTVWHTDQRHEIMTANPGDRGWGDQARPAVVATVSRSFSDSAAPRRTEAPASRPAPPAERPQSYSQTETHGALIGIQSSQDTRAYSNRGQQSLQSANHSAPASHATASPKSSGGGGGHDSDQKHH